MGGLNGEGRVESWIRSTPEEKKKQNAWTPCATEEWAERLFLEVRCVYGGSKALLAAPWGWNCHLQREK